MTNLMRVACPVCDGKGEIPDDRDVVVVCHGCLGKGYHFENAPAPVCDVDEHEEVRA